MAPIITDNPQTFWRKTRNYLIQREAENCLLIGKIKDEIRDKRKVSDCVFFLFGDETQFLAGMYNATRQSVVLGTSPQKHAMDVVRLLKERRVSVAHLIGPREVTKFLSQSISEPERPLALLLELNLYELSDVKPCSNPSGRFRNAKTKDLPIIAEWTIKFMEEALLQTPKQSATQIIPSLDKKKQFVWEDGKIVSMASVTGDTPNGARVVGVYTPPEARGKGYGAACVAELSAELLRNGKSRVYLFADKNNPQSNHIYQRIGYQLVGTFEQYRAKDLS
jgi:uncharacterized protein